MAWKHDSADQETLTRLHLHVSLFSSRREDKLRIPNGWLCHLAPEIIQQLSPDTEEDKLPFSKQSDVFAFG